jgi:hypothetical protein
VVDHVQIKAQQYITINRPFCGQQPAITDASNICFAERRGAAMTHA